MASNDAVMAIVAIGLPPLDHVHSDGEPDRKTFRAFSRLMLSSSMSSTAVFLSNRITYQPKSLGKSDKVQGTRARAYWSKN